MYSLFTKYAGQDCDEIRDNLSSWAHSNETELKVLTKDAFDDHKYNLNMWTLIIINKRHPGNELTLYCLCKIYNPHAIIYDEIDYWTTLECNSQETEESIVGKCDIVLIYLGNNKFCEVLQEPGENEESMQTSRQRVTKSIHELTKDKVKGKIQKSKAKTTSVRVKLNPIKHNHNTRGSVHKWHNDRPSRSTSHTISYIPDPTSSDTESECPLKHYKPTDTTSDAVRGASRPSTSRIRAQEKITHNKLQTRKDSTSRLIGTCIVSPPAKIKEEDNNKAKIKIEIKIKQNRPLTQKQKEHW